MDHVQADVDEIRQELLDAPARVQPEVHVQRVGLGDQFLVVRLEELAENLEREERPGLHPDVVAGHDRVAVLLTLGPLQPDQVKVRQLAEQPMHAVRIGVVVHQGVGHAPQRPVPLEQAEPPGRDAIPPVARDRRGRQGLLVIRVGEVRQHAVQLRPVADGHLGVVADVLAFVGVAEIHPPILRVVLPAVKHSRLIEPDPLRVLGVLFEDFQDLLLAILEGVGMHPHVQQDRNAGSVTSALDNFSHLVACQSGVFHLHSFCL